MHFRNLPALLILLSACILSGCTNSKHLTTKEHPPEEKPAGVTAIRNVNVIPMTSENRILKNATIVIENNKIASINAAVPEEAQVIDGTGKWLIPGLVDMHVHGLADINFSAAYPTKGAGWFVDTQDVMLPYVANGVTTVFELSARVEHFAQRNEIAKGTVIGPRMALAALVNGGEGSGRNVNTPAAGRQAVKSAKAEGYGFIKVYSDLDEDTFKAIVEEANEQDLKVIGHIPNTFKGQLQEAFVPHFSMVAHTEEFSKHAVDYSAEEATAFARLAAENGTWLTPTLTTMARIAQQAHSLDSVRNLKSLPYVHPLMQSKWLTSNNYNKGSSPERVAHLEKLVNFHKLLVKAFKEAGVPMVAGTDAGTSGVVWGYSLHDELELLADAGLSNEEVLLAATRLPATWLEIEDKIGTVETGKFADLVLLNANPMEDIENTRKIAGVFFNGRWVPRATIDQMLEDLARKNDAAREEQLWEKRREF